MKLEPVYAEDASKASMVGFDGARAFWTSEHRRPAQQLMGMRVACSDLGGGTYCSCSDRAARSPHPVVDIYLIIASCKERLLNRIIWSRSLQLFQTIV
jgi:hypothetical protein